ncbi:class I SAM-dependent methyltransferase [Cyanobacterium aponinum AL20118]|uniref:Class I SAM-dependent methyltransferase n=1 Tax=Cyanobacterium aponinum AL20115 TaxID=3090662 RepID=A0AAF1C0B9_9CHRO|nr:class I SAM-dependent methyltransferase [Cyanobacterium aponinum]WPF87427.1 class I SAM-dependent methyltransferase [Cyanobacterium aponinum AL20115]
MEDYQLLIDLHKNAYRQGPGGDTESKKALDLGMLDKSQPLKIADIGCGTGASALLLGNLLDAQITAVDFLQDFLDILNTRAKNSGLAEKISTLCCSMENLPFEDEEYDVIWSEGAIYNMGFEKGVIDWNRYLKVGGLLVVSEITWISNSRPLEIQQYWEKEYPEIDVSSSKIKILEKNGYSPIGYFVLPEHCWLDNYYQPMQNNFQDFLLRNGNSEDARAIVEAENEEIELYKKYKNYYSYGVYIAKKLHLP